MKIVKVETITTSGVQFNGWFSPENCEVFKSSATGNIKPILYITKNNHCIVYNGYNSYNELSQVQTIDWFITNSYSFEEIPDFLHDTLKNLEIK